MMKKIIFAVFLWAGWMGFSIHAEVSVPAIIGSNMVFQSGSPAKIWGWANPGEEVTVSMEEAREITAAGTDGKWSTELELPEPGGPYVLHVIGGNRLEFTNILVGEVWLCSGQSQMEQGIRFADSGWNTIRNSADNELRLFLVERQQAFVPQESIQGHWVVCSPETILEGGWGGFSAVGYFFGAKLRQELNVPVGMIQSAVGGTPIETWMSREVLESEPKAEELLQKWESKWKWFLRKYPGRFVSGEKPGVTASGHYGEFVNMPKGWHWFPAIHFNGMIAPIQPFTIRGVLWYQGYANRFHTDIYPDFFSDMVESWRKGWDLPALPFCFAQHSAFATTKDKDRKLLARLREAQTRGLELANTGMVVTYDLSGSKNLHYGNKQPVAERMVSWALRHVYKQPGSDADSPIFKQAVIEKDGIHLFFDHAGSGFITEDNSEPQGFIIAGADQIFHPAKAHIVGSTVVVSSVDVPEPEAVRYGWLDDPSDLNLKSQSGLPVSPFRTDSWPLP